MHNFIFRWITKLRQNYWFWPSVMTVCAVLLGFVLPYLDARVGSDWIREAGFVRTIEVDGARAILTTLATATLGVAGVAFSVTIVAVSFASSNYGPRLIGNFMADRKNQVILGIFVATFVYCITVLTTVHASTETPGTTLDAFVPHLSLYFALLLTLAAVGALIAYIHHIPESINIMNLTAEIGAKLQSSVIRMLDEEDSRMRDTPDAHHMDVEAWFEEPQADDAHVVRAEVTGFVQKFDLENLAALALKNGIQIVLHRSPGDFVVMGETVLSTRPARSGAGAIDRQMRDCFTQGDNRTDAQDILFLSDQLVEVLGRALSPGINDPRTAMLCLDWLRAGLVAFAARPPSQPAKSDDPVLYRRVAFEDMLNRSFAEMRQCVATNRTVTLQAMDVLTDIAQASFQEPMARACVQQICQLAGSAMELLDESVAREEIATELKRALQAVAAGGAHCRDPIADHAAPD
ncbi:DUF2254 domain-containing protein [Rhodobacteraceae bacterium 2376]|uniref:DUF2254 domain-containing protein n=1 Tax=Rhabdonatronobacter sediminivivens TaxID=2743469 RepID=A0A7Z0KZC2_9RHOB|nr:DUF2254 domain-containing protein [Rhabdonatronobacter sediminivivens]NYS26239.1 DUF2254 domain-containing protein [Rhabdonatronobacter sediminivivens]